MKVSGAWYDGEEEVKETWSSQALSEASSSSIFWLACWAQSWALYSPAPSELTVWLAQRS